MSEPREPRQITAVGNYPPASFSDPRVPLLNLSYVSTRMESLHCILSDSMNRNALLRRDQMELVSSELVSAIHQTIANGTALLACTQPQVISAAKPPKPSIPSPAIHVAKGEAAEMEVEPIQGIHGGGDGEIVEIDAVELLAEHFHVCDICGKGFKRDANLRMHMRAHGNQFKTLEALAKPVPPPASAVGRECEATKQIRFSCPFQGCNRNRLHKKFRALKSVICVKNHFKRSHCPKMYSCNLCHKKNFSVLADLKNHLRHCGEAKWRCSCGTSFSRKDKLFGHMALFEGHMPAIGVGVAVSGEEDEKVKAFEVEEDDDEDEAEGKVLTKPEPAFGKEEPNHLDYRVFEGMLEEFGVIEGFNLQEFLESPRDSGNRVDGLFGFSG